MKTKQYTLYFFFNSSLCCSTVRLLDLTLDSTRLDSTRLDSTRLGSARLGAPLGSNSLSSALHFTSFLTETERYNEHFDELTSIKIFTKFCLKIKEPS